MPYWAFAVGVVLSAHVAWAASPQLRFTGKVQWSCLGTWFYPADSSKAFALLLNDEVRQAHPELEMPDFPIAAAATYEASFEGTIMTEPSCYPQAPCDWRTWPGSDKLEYVGCIHVTGMTHLERQRPQPKAP